MRSRAAAGASCASWFSGISDCSESTRVSISSSGTVTCSVGVWSVTLVGVSLTTIPAIDRPSSVTTIVV